MGARAGNQRHCGLETTSTHTAAGGLLQLLGWSPTLFPEPRAGYQPHWSSLAPPSHRRPGCPALQAPCGVEREGAALRVAGGGEPPRPALMEETSVLAKPKGASFSSSNQEKPPPLSVQPSPSLRGQSPGRGGEGGVSYRIWGDGVSLPQLHKLDWAVLKRPASVFPEAKTTEQTPSPLRLPSAEGGTVA